LIPPQEAGILTADTRVEVRVDGRECDPAFIRLRLEREGESFALAENPLEVMVQRNVRTVDAERNQHA
jgi:hypothetical protein